MRVKRRKRATSFREREKERDRLARERGLSEERNLGNQRGKPGEESVCSRRKRVVLSCTK